jgi:uncharacterized caspase-like protein
MASVRWSAVVCAVALALNLTWNAPGRADDPEATRFVLAIGVNKYANRQAMQQPNLECADGDARLVANALAGSRVRLLTTSSARVGLVGDNATATDFPTANNIRQALGKLVQDANAAGDRAEAVIVTFAGYERQFANDKDYYLCPSDADPRDKTTLIALSQVYAELARCKAPLKLVVIDACRGQEQAAGGLPQQPEGIATLFACSAGEVAYEDAKQLRHGYLSYFISQGLKGEADEAKTGKVTLDQLVQYLRRTVPERVQKDLKEKQTPELVGKTSTEVSLIPSAGKAR